MIVVKARDVHKSFGQQKVLKGLSLDVNEGETLVILGQSGGGKSVLLRLIIGLETADSGSIELFGEELAKLTQKQKLHLQRNMGMLFQNGALFDSMNVYENTSFYLREHGDPLTGKYLDEKTLRNRALETLELVGLRGAEDKMPAELSGGMRKRAALARALIYKPKLLLCDEPTAGLDPVIAMQINRLIEKTKLECGTTNIVVTHELRSALEIGDRFAFHSDGRIIQIGTRKDFFSAADPILRNFLENAIFANPLQDGANVRSCPQS